MMRDVDTSAQQTRQGTPICIGRPLRAARAQLSCSPGVYYAGTPITDHAELSDALGISLGRKRRLPNRESGPA